jgi:hypothetical protein
VVAVISQAWISLVGAHENFLDEIIDIQTDVGLLLWPKKPPKIGEQLVVVSVDQFLKTLWHSTHLRSQWYNEKLLGL